MPAPPLPPDEVQRLSALRSLKLLDSPPDPRFDLFAGLASRLFDMPISAVSLLDADRLWFKSLNGLNVSEVPRTLAFCAHAVLQPSEVMVVEDLAGDPRFQDSPLVQGPDGLRFYAGAPIHSVGGMAMGTLCVLDHRPRILDEAGRQRLADLAQGVGTVMELHRVSLLLHDAASQDDLTGLANPRAFLPVLEDAVRGAAAAPCALLYLDLDEFKALNSRCGHAGADAVLQQVAARLRATLREGDLAARLHGDEFAVLIRGPVTRAAAEALGRALHSALQVPVQLGTDRVAVSVSGGIALAPADAGTGDALLHAADMALFAAKTAGRGRVMGLGTPVAAPSLALEPQPG